ncbi:MAG: hypothetical protein H6747_07425 [Deltaproteobacteria bacterium]|nr:hypothetical protein [Deltaproteobacteria bacterium]
MGLFDFFTGGGDPQKQIEKHRKRLTDRFRQTYERYEAMDALAKMATSDAYAALLARFTIRVDGPTVDEEEKTYCYDLLRNAGEAAVAPIEAFIAKNTAVYFPLRALREVAGDDRAVDALLAAMDDCDPGYHEGLERLREIVSNLRDFQHERVRAALATLVDSRSDEIRFFALDGLASYPSDQIAPLFVTRLVEDESQRVRALICELAIEHDLDFNEHRDALAGRLGEQYRLGDDGRIQRNV